VVRMQTFITFGAMKSVTSGESRILYIYFWVNLGKISQYFPPLQVGRRASVSCDVHIFIPRPIIYTKHLHTKTHCIYYTLYMLYNIYITHT